MQAQDAGMQTSLFKTLRHRIAILSIAVSLHAVIVHNAADLSVYMVYVACWQALLT